MDGLRATKLIRERERTMNLAPTPIIGLSGNSRKQQIATALNGGMSDYMYALTLSTNPATRLS
jgi:CheY-like chemotaxis protein